MEVSKEELEGLMLAAVKAALAEERTEFRVPSRQHFLDHEQMARCAAAMPTWAANHDFVTEFRMNVEAVKRSAVRSALKLLGIALVALCVWATAKVKGWL